MIRLPITAVILTLDEGRNIGRCLEALARVDDVVIVDSGSTDDTLDQARAVRTDVRVFYHPFRDFGDQRNWAIDNVSNGHEWMLFVDADEYCEPEFLLELAEFLENPGNVVGGYVAGRNYFLGRWLKFSTLYPSFQLRLLKLGCVRYVREGHGQREVTDGPLRYLKYGWRHEAFSKGVRQWISRHNDYSDNEISYLQDARLSPIMPARLFAADAIVRRRELKKIAAQVPARPLWRFLYMYFWRLGFLDGRAGLDYSLLCLAHEISLLVKLREARYLQGQQDSQGG